MTHRGLDPVGRKIGSGGASSLTGLPLLTRSWGVRSTPLPRIPPRHRERPDPTPPPPTPQSRRDRSPFGVEMVRPSRDRSPWSVRGPLGAGSTRTSGSISRRKQDGRVGSCLGGTRVPKGLNTDTSPEVGPLTPTLSGTPRMTRRDPLGRVQCLCTHPPSTPSVRLPPHPWSGRRDSDGGEVGGRPRWQDGRSPGHVAGHLLRPCVWTETGELGGPRYHCRRTDRPEGRDRPCYRTGRGMFR